MDDWLELGYVGLFGASFLAATILPFSSEALIIGMLAGNFNPSMTLLVATAGNWLGGMSSYGIGYLGKWEWIESKLKVSIERVLSFKKWIDKYGPYTAILCWAPLIGDPIAIALGIFKSNPFLVSFLMLIGKFLRYLAIYHSFHILN